MLTVCLLKPLCNTSSIAIGFSVGPFLIQNHLAKAIWNAANVFDGNNTLPKIYVKLCALGMYDTLCVFAWER